jgi:predicted alpha/beta superfamily hydrolase
MWDPAQKILNTQDGLQWSITLTLPCPFDLEYKLTKGSWETEATDTNGMPLSNFKLALVSDTLVRHKIDSWKEDKGKPIMGGVTGELHFIDSLCFRGLQPRKIAVWLPPGYHRDSLRRYPVLYMHDGQNLFDPEEAIFGIDWGLDEAADSLIREAVISPLIMVGIYNTPDRMKEYWVGDTGSLYREMLTSRIKPLIDSLYRTRPGKKHSAIGGSSAGGLAAFISLWEQGDVFSKALCFSPAFIVDGETTKINYVEKVREQGTMDTNRMVYIWNGGIGIDSMLDSGVQSMKTELEAQGFRHGHNLKVIIDALGEHTESHWRKEVPAALKWLFAARP